MTSLSLVKKKSSDRARIAVSWYHTGSNAHDEARDEDGREEGSISLCCSFNRSKFALLCFVLFDVERENMI